MTEESRHGFAALDPCVHCGFCLPACPTYLATGDEADSPRGRIVLMRALEREEIPADDAALLEHLDACLGCRGCEPACPSGVEYGRGLAAAREVLAERGGINARARAVLTVFRYSALWRPLFTAARWLRDSNLPRRLAGGGRLRFAMGMLAASGPVVGRKVATRSDRSRVGRSDGFRPDRQHSDVPTFSHSHLQRPERRSAVLFRGCVMDSLFSHVHEATRRTLEANGYDVVEVERQVCCGALHDHAGERAVAVTLARENVRGLIDSADFIVVNSAGCGAMLKEYGRLLDEDQAGRFAQKVRDVSELLAEQGPREGGPLELDVAYDAPCHLQHAQKVHAAPLAVFRAVPHLRLRLLPGSDRCCGSAGIYSVLRPELAREVLRDKIAAFAAADPRPQIVATGNPGCLMQIGAGLRAAGLSIDVAHPVELLDWSYAVGGVYGESGARSRELGARVAQHF